MSVKVAVRARPLNASEMMGGAQIAVRMNGNEVEVAVTGSGASRVFRYDRVLWSVGQTIESSTNSEATQETVYDAIGADMLEHTLTGYNGCIFAYGQTGSGKTYSMMGTEENPGVVPRLAESLFQEVERLRQSHIEACIEVSYYEIYCEKVRCLLRPNAGGFADSVLRVREHPKFGPFIEGLAKFVVTSQREFLQLMNDGNKVRTTASTAMNATSSRSHSVFAITLTQKKKNGKLTTTTTSKLNLVDLAGSERVSKTLATGTRLMEGANINQSLTCLGHVISALAEVGETGKSRHIPYRDSVLTWILKDNLGGNSKTVMLAAISPSSAQYEETMSTLRYAERAKKVMNKAVVNESNSNEVIAALQKEIANLKLQLNDASAAERARLLEELAASEAVQRELGASLEEKLDETKRMMEERERYMEELESKLEAQNNEIEDLKRTNDEKEQKIADLLRRIEALASAAPTTAITDGGWGGGTAKAGGSDGELMGSPSSTGAMAVDMMRAEVAALEQEQNATETQIKGKRRLTEVADPDEVRMRLEADAPMDFETAEVSAGGALIKAPSRYLDEGAVAEEIPAALRWGMRLSLASRDGAAADAAAGVVACAAELGADSSTPIDAELDSLDSFDEALFEATETTESTTVGIGEAVDHSDGGLEIDSDIDLDDEDGGLEVDNDIVLDDMEEVVADCLAHAPATVAVTAPTSEPTQGSAAATATSPPSAVVQSDSRCASTAAAAPQPAAVQESRQSWSSETAGRLPELPPGTDVVCVETVDPESAVARAAQQRQQQQRAMDSAAALQIWAKSDAKPQIFAPVQQVVELVVPSHALPNNRYLHEPFRVVKMKGFGMIGHRKDRIWDIDFFNHTFSNYDLNGAMSFSLPSSHLFRVEKDRILGRRLTLYFFDAPHPYELEFASASRRRRFYELAMLQRRDSILWCPSLCLDGENDVAITVRGTTIERPNRVLAVEGESKLTVARMPYEVGDLWYGCFSLQNGPMPRNAAVFGSFVPKAAHDVYIFGLTDVPAALLGTDAIGQYFANYLGYEEYHVVGTTTMDALKRRSTSNAMVVICRRSFIVRISHVQLMEAPTVHRKDVSRGDFTGAACAITINEATLCAILVNAKVSKYSTQTRNACIRTLITSLPFGDPSVDIAARFDYLIISGTFGYPATEGAPFTTRDPLVQQIQLNNYMSNMQESEPSAALKMVPDPMRVFFAARPRVSRMDVGLYTSSRALPLPNVYITADIFAQRTYLSVFGEAVPRTQIIFDHLHIAGDRLPDVSKAHLMINGDFFENAPLTAHTLKEGHKQYAASAAAIPIVYPSVSNAEFLRLQTVYFSLVGVIGSSGHGKPTTLASGALPLKNIVALGERKEFAVPLYYHSCLVGALQGSILEIFYEKNDAELAAAGLSRERFVSLVTCYENQVRLNGVWTPASAQPPFCNFSSKDPSQEQRKESFELPDPRSWRWLSDWHHDSRPDDSEGWIYSDGGCAPLEFKESRHSTIRRRRWVREMQAQDPTALHAYLSLKNEQYKENTTG